MLFDVIWCRFGDLNAVYCILEPSMVFKLVAKNMQCKFFFFFLPSHGCHLISVTCTDQTTKYLNNIIYTYTVVILTTNTTTSRVKPIVSRNVFLAHNKQVMNATTPDQHTVQHIDCFVNLFSHVKNVKKQQ